MNYTNALTLFREGKDTTEIAAILGCSEAEAYHEAASLRDDEYHRRHAGPKRFAGFDPSERPMRKASK